MKKFICSIFKLDYFKKEIIEMSYVPQFERKRKEWERTFDAESIKK